MLQKEPGLGALGIFGAANKRKVGALGPWCFRALGIRGPGALVPLVLAGQGALGPLGKRSCGDVSEFVP